MKRFPLFFWFVLLLFLFLVSSCNQNSLDFNKLSNEVSLNPEFVAPIAKVNISVWDMLQSVNKNNDSVITKDPVSGLVKIVYKKDNLYTYNVRNFNFPSFSVPSRTITLANLISTLGGGLNALTPLDGMTVPFPALSFPSIVSEFNLNQITDFNSVTFKKGSLGITLENKLKVPITIIGSLYDMGNNRIVADFTFENITPNGIANKSMSLAGIQLSNKVEFSMSTFKTPGSGLAAVKIDLNDYFKLTFNINNLEFKSITGDFGKQQINIGPEQFDMNIDLLNKLDGSFTLANPKLKLIFNNPIGMPALLDVGFKASNKSGSIVTLKKKSGLFEIPVPTSMDKPATGSIVFDKDNSNIVDFIALPPTGKIWYQGQVSFNQNNQVTQDNPNFLDLDNSFSFGIEMELPLELQTSALTFKDTSAISGSDYDKIESAELILNARNGIPLDVDLQLFFVDTISKKQFGTSKKTKVLTAAQVNASGDITPVKSSNSFSLDKGEMENLRKANGIVIMGTVSSPSGGTGVAKIMSTSEIDLNVVIKSKVNL